MSLDKLATELDETARQTAEMIYKINESLEVLMDTKVDCQTARDTAVQQMIVALQAQDRIQQRSDNIARAARVMAKVIGEVADKMEHDEVWAGLTLDELRKPGLHAVTARAEPDDIELF